MNLDARELAATFDLEKLTPEFYANPYPTYRALRETRAGQAAAERLVFPDPLRRPGCAPTRTPRPSRRTRRRSSRRNTATRLLYEHHTTSLVFNDPPAHTRVRRLIMGALSPRAIAGMEPDLIAAGRPPARCHRRQGEGKVDLIEDFAAAIPIEVIGNLLDVPARRARAVARLVAGHPRRAGAGDRPGGVCPRQQGGDGDSSPTSKRWWRGGGPSPAIPTTTC